jgi:hypothetical protein
MPDQSSRRCVGQHVINLHDGQSCVDRHSSDAEPTARVHEFDVSRSVREKEAQAVASVETGSDEGAGQASNLVMKLSKRQLRFAETERVGIGVIADRAFQRMDIYH